MAPAARTRIRTRYFALIGVLPGINERDCREVKGMPRAACDGPQPGGMDCSFGRRAAGHQPRRARNSASALQVWPRPERAFSGGPWNTMRPPPSPPSGPRSRSEEHTSELQSHSDLVCRLLLEKKKKRT